MSVEITTIKKYQAQLTTAQNSGNVEWQNQIELVLLGIASNLDWELVELTNKLDLAPQDKELNRQYKQAEYGFYLAIGAIGALLANAQKAYAESIRQIAPTYQIPEQYRAGNKINQYFD